ncbi:MAG: hypothetical protein ACRD6W_03725 [Nitrososphaerales archaeon]
MTRTRALPTLGRMPELFFSGPAQEGIRRLEAGPQLEVLLTRVNEVLDLIEREPGSAEARRMRFREPPSWGIQVGFREHSFVVTWMSGTEFATWADPSDVLALSQAVGDDLAQWAIVLYVGPRPE